MVNYHIEIKRLLPLNPRIPSQAPNFSLSKDMYHASSELLTDKQVIDVRQWSVMNLKLGSIITFARAEICQIHGNQHNSQQQYAKQRETLPILYRTLRHNQQK